MAKGPKPFLDLWDFAPVSPAEMLLLEDRLLVAGVSVQRAGRIPMRLYRLYATGRDGLNGSDRTEYRKELAKLEAPPWGWGRGMVIRAKGAYDAPKRPRIFAVVGDVAARAALAAA